MSVHAHTERYDDTYKIDHYEVLCQIYGPNIADVQNGQYIEAGDSVFIIMLYDVRMESGLTGRMDFRIMDRMECGNDRNIFR